MPAKLKRRSQPAYTWDNRQSGEANVNARLDRAFANEEFRQHFQHIRIRHLPSVESDHCFVVAEIKENMPNMSRAKKQFRYENVWASHVDYDQIVAKAWQEANRGPGLQGVADSLDHLKQILEPWGAREFGCLTHRVRQLQKKLGKLRCRSIGRGPTDEEKAIANQLREALHQEEIWFRQRSRVPWLRDGDRNTAYFQTQAAQCKRINKI